MTITKDDSPAANLRPILELWEWHVKSLCRTTDNSEFFVDDGEVGMEKRRKEELAKRVCRECPVRKECLAHAISVPENYGVWGGLTENERRKLIRQLGKNRMQALL